MKQTTYVATHTTGSGFWQEGLGTLRAREQDSHENLICMATGQAGAEIVSDGSPSLTCNHEAPMVLRAGMQVRRLTPLECERLQGFPDHYTATTKADGPRYKALGNSMAVPVMKWIGERIMAVEHGGS
jgi:site-specific DNA-cytosine methylase